MTKLLKFLNDAKGYIIAAVIILAAGGAYVYFSNQDGKNYETFTVQSVDLGQSIEATGFLQPTTSVDLAFHTSGEVGKVNVDVGDRVKKGDTLASLTNDSQKAALAQTKGILSEAQAALNLELAQATDQDIAIARADVQQAVASKEKTQVDYNNSLTDLDNTKKTVAQDIKTAELNLDDAKLNLQKVEINSSTATQQSDTSVTNAALAVKTALDQLLVAAKGLLQSFDKIFGFEGPSIFNTANSITIVGSAEYISAQNLYSQDLQSYKDLQATFDAFPSTPSADDLLKVAVDVTGFIKTTNDCILAVTVVLDKLSTNSQFQYSDLTQLRTEITASGGTFNAAAASYNTAKKTLDDATINQSGTGSTSPLDVESARLAVTQAQQNLTKVQVNGDTQISTKETASKALTAELQVAQAEVDRSNAALEKTLASPRSVDVAPYRARVQQAQAQVDKAQSDLDNTLIKAPFDGIMTAKNIDPGEQFLIASGVANQPALSIIDDSQFHIDVNIPETQIIKISTDSKVTVTFDALDTEETFDGKILSIEPASTTVQDIIYYKAKVALVKADKRLKAGMTANVTIASDSPNKVLAIPERAIVLDDNNNKTVLTSPGQSVQIRTGVRGENGMIEVVSGLKEGDTILVPLN